MRKSSLISIVRRVFVIMSMDFEIFKELFGRLFFVLNFLRVIKFLVFIYEFDIIMFVGWLVNIFRILTICRLQFGKFVELVLLERRKVFYDYFRCLRCQGGNGVFVVCKDVVRRIVYGLIVLKVLFYRERNKEVQKKFKERIRLVWVKFREVSKQIIIR